MERNLQDVKFLSAMPINCSLQKETTILDLSFALNITFIAKEGADYGGPSKEFLGAVMRELCDQLFDEAGSEEYIYTNIILEQG